MLICLWGLIDAAVYQEKTVPVQSFVSQETSRFSCFAFVLVVVLFPFVCLLVVGFLCNIKSNPSVFTAFGFALERKVSEKGKEGKVHKRETSRMETTGS
jgi:hypothetical protein